MKSFYSINAQEAPAENHPDHPFALFNMDWIAGDRLRKGESKTPFPLKVDPAIGHWNRFRTMEEAHKAAAMLQKYLDAVDPVAADKKRK